MSVVVSFMSANYVAREVGYRMPGGWGQGDRATNERFRPPETFAGRFAEIAADVRALGFEAIDVWTSHLNPDWATPRHLADARAVLAEHGLAVASMGGWFGSTLAAFEACCRVAVGLGTGVLGGSTRALADDRAGVVAALRASGLRLGVENHPERTADELRAAIGDPDGTVGATVDTGWFGTQGFDAADAIEALADVLVSVHLKDVREAGGHATCAFGDGVVPIRRCVATLERIAFRGGICVEHEPDDRDPTDEIRTSKARLDAWRAGRDA